ncbi:ABC transporter permease [Spiroplasma endosymbiont of Amphibalanus improvisus]|uniref:ABC transporter permease n=1 Tax=Spiroplasma endosymbiont of Amphibalanus improvisus TaxID=3066327 RepID=UPI00313AC7BA
MNNKNKVSEFDNSDIKNKGQKANRNFFKLLSKNNLKTMSGSKAQLSGLILLTLLLTIVFSIFSATSVRIDGSLKALNESSNLHDVMVDYYDTTLNNPVDFVYSDSNNANASGENWDYSDNEQALLLKYEDTYNYSFDRLESRTFTVGDDEKILKIFSYTPTQQIDKMLMTKGQWYYDDNNNLETYQIVLNEEFAKNNDIKIGDVIRIIPDDKGSNLKAVDNNFKNYNDFINWKNTSDYKENNVFMVSGFGVSANMSTPIIDQTTVIPDKKNDCVAYTPYENFGLSQQSNGIWEYDIAKDIFTVSSQANQEISYALDFHDSNYTNDLSGLNNTIKQHFTNNNNHNSDIAFDVNDSSYRFSSRTSTIVSTMNTFIMSLLIFMLSLGIITIFALVIVIKKRIQKQSKQLGVLKSLGVSNKSLMAPFVMYPLIISLISGTIGYIIGSILQVPVVYAFSNYFNLDFGSYYFDFISFLVDIFGLFLLLYIFVNLVVFIYLQKDVIKLIKTAEIVSFGSVPRKIKGLFVKTKFKTRFKVSVFSSSLGKMSAVSVTMLLGTLLMSISVVFPKILSDNLTKSYDGINYKTLTEYTDPVWNIPTTYYKTYDPDNVVHPYDPNTDPEPDPNWNTILNRQTNESILNDLYDQTQSAQYFTANVDYSKILANSLFPGTISNLQWKILSKDFLSSLDGMSTLPAVAYITISMAWPDYANFNTNVSSTKGITSPSIRSYTKQDWVSVIEGLSGDELNNLYDTYRNFYIKYRNTINMSVNEKFTDLNTDESKNPDISSGDLKWGKISSISDPDLFHYKFDIDDHHLDDADDQKVITSSADDLSESEKKELSIKMMAWYMYTFDSRAGVGVLMGTYSRSPYFVQQNILSAFNDDNKEFNISFGVNPFNPDTDYLGTKLNTSYQDFNFSTYGIDSDFDMITLKDQQGNDIQNNLNLEDPLDPNANVYPIIINQSLAKKFSLTKGSKIDLSYSVENAVDNDKDIDPTDFAFAPTFEVNENYLNQSEDWNNYQYNGNYIYNAGTTGADPSQAYDNFSDGTWKIENQNKKQQFEVVGIADFYGEPSAYISDDVANHLLKYDNSESQQSLYDIFRHSLLNGDVSSWTDKDLDSDNNAAMVAINTNDQLSDLINAASTGDPGAVRALDMFHSEFPIYNYKMSKNDELVDITQGISTTSPFGDDSATGLNGYYEADLTYKAGYGMSSYTTLMPVYGEKMILNQITQLIDIVLFVFGLVSLFISVVIIMLSTNLIISENKRQIISLKVLGYKNWEIADILMGVYPPIMIIMFLIGFPIAWFLIELVVGQLAVSSSFILPLFFSWWLPVVVFLIICFIFFATLIFSILDLRKAEVTKYINFEN